MAALRVYKTERLQGLSKKQLGVLMDGVKTNQDLTRAEIDANIDIIALHMNDGVRPPNVQIIADIEAGSADISDIN